MIEMWFLFSASWGWQLVSDDLTVGFGHSQMGFDKAPPRAILVHHVAGIIPIYSEKKASNLLPKMHGRGVRESWGKDDWVRKRSRRCTSGCPRSRGRTERTAEDSTISYELHPLIFSIFSPPLCLESQIQRHSHVIPLENKPPPSWDPGQGEGCEA